jgi:hypothetical protein
MCVVLLDFQNVLICVGDTEGLAGDDVSFCADRRMITANTTRCQLVLLSALQSTDILTICITSDSVIF